MAQQVVRNAPPFDDVVIRRIMEFYSCDRPNEIRTLLASMPRLIPILNELPAKIRCLFGRDRPLRLDIAADPEFPSEKQILVYVSAEADAEVSWNDAERRIHQLQTDWLSHLPRADTRGFNLEVE